MTGHGGRIPSAFVAAYVVLLLIYFVASFFTDLRLWGLSVWGYLPPWGRIVLFGLGIALIPLILSVRTDRPTGSGTRRRSFVVATVAVSLVGCALFWLFRGNTHFLGDGYGNLAMLSSRVPTVNFRDYGEVLAHLSLAKLLGGNSRENVLLSYQLLSVAAGVLLIWVVAWTARRLYAHTRDAVIFAGTVLCSGYLLLFFGYVENYSLLVLAIGSFASLGLLAARGIVSRWIVLFPLIGAIFFHILGIVLAPSAVYVLFAGSRHEKRWERQSRGTKTVIVVSLFLAVGAAFWYAAGQSLAFRISLLSLFESPFTVNGYTLLSKSHLVDLGNLFLILLPGLPILILVLLKLPVKALLKLTEYRFLAMLSVGALIPAFVFDPKLGMPRDWDLFSFAAVPLTVFLGFSILDERNRVPYGRAVLIMATGLALLALTPRVLTQYSPSMALAQIEDYIALERVRGKGAMIQLQAYYSGIRDQENFARWVREFRACPEEVLAEKADSLIAANRLPEALSHLRQALKINPMMSSPYASRSVISLRMGRAGEARAALDTALAISPHNPKALLGKGFFLQTDGDLTGAERLYIRGTEIAPEQSLAYFYLARLYRTIGDTAQYVRNLEFAASKSDAAMEVKVELCTVYAERGRWREAGGVLRDGIERGLSQQLVNDVLRRYPELRNAIAP